MYDAGTSRLISAEIYVTIEKNYVFNSGHLIFYDIPKSWCIDTNHKQDFLR